MSRMWSITRTGRKASMPRFNWIGLLVLLITALLSANSTAMAADNNRAINPEKSSYPPDIEARSATLTDQAGNVLYKKNEQLRMYPASTTKILTALLAAENCELDNLVTAGPEINLVPVNSGRCGLQEGESITMRDLIYGMLLRSGNDAAMTIAVQVARKANPDLNMSEQEALGEFSWMMNQRAQEIGAMNSHFVNPHGLHEPDHYSTAHDLALITLTAMKDPFLSEVVATPSYVPSSKIENRSGQGIIWVNTNKLLDQKNPFFMADASGVKTGHTEQAGYCLISSAYRQQVRLYAVVLNSSQDGVWRDSIQLLEYGFAHPFSQEADEDQAKTPKKANLSTPVLPRWTYYLLFAVGATLLTFVGIGFARLAVRNKPQP